MADYVSALVYGASVSEQSGEQGYFSNLLEYLTTVGGSTKYLLSRLTFPSAHFNDAGFVHLDDIILLSPKILIFEWLTTGEDRFDQDKLNYFFSKILKSGIFPIVVDLPRLDSIENRRPNHFQIKKLASEFSIPFIDVTGEVRTRGLNILDITRDGVHTNQIGAEIYSKSIADVLLNNMMSHLTQRPTRFPLSLDSLRVSRVGIGSGLSCGASNAISLKIHPTFVSECYRVEIYSYVILGPFSPILEISSSCSGEIAELALFDQWCHYERRAFRALCPPLQIADSVALPITMNIRVSEKTPQYELVKVPGFNPPAERHFRLIQAIYSVNCSLSYELT
jgi:hypothetical protein